MVTIRELKEPLRIFLEERDWLRFNSKSSLAKTLFIECGELSESFFSRDEEGTKEEVGDVYSALLQIDMLREKETGQGLSDEQLNRYLEKAEIPFSDKELVRSLLIKSAALLQNALSEESYYSLYKECLSLFYALLLKKGYDGKTCLLEKLKKTAAHYPVALCKGKATKYTDL